MDTKDEKDKVIIEIEESKLLLLMDENESYKKDVDDLLKVAKGICGVLGLTDEKGNVKKSFLDNTESPMPSILKAILSTATLMGQAQLPIIGKKAEAEIAQKFDFIKYLTPILEKHKQ